jgi:uncharacterized DUF497 family protein
MVFGSKKRRLSGRIDPLRNDSDHSESEDRFIRVGHSTRSRVLLVVFCERNRGRTVRIISARKATPREVKAHEEGI